MRLKRAFVVLAALVAWAAPTSAFAAEENGTGEPPDDEVDGTIPGEGGHQETDNDASHVGCPGGGVQWTGASPAEIEAARRNDPPHQGGPNPPRPEGFLYRDDLRNEALFPQAIWYRCLTNPGGWLLFDLPVQGLEPIDFEDLVDPPKLVFYPTAARLVVDYPTQLTLEGGGTQVLPMPAAAGQFRAVPQEVIWKTGVGNRAVTCLDLTGGNQVRKNLEPLANPSGRPPGDACVHRYTRPSTEPYAGRDGTFEVVVELTYAIEQRATAADPWATYQPDPVAVVVTDPEPVSVREIQAVAD